MKRGSQDSNLEPPVLETGTLPIELLPLWQRILPVSVRPIRERMFVAMNPPEATAWQPLDEAAYAYLLGMYLGDGYLSASGATACLQVALDESYPRIIEECDAAISVLLPHARVARYKRQGSVRLQVSSRQLLQMIPQHGPGRKHQRPIKLATWQRRITEAFPEALLRGLIHSDGCRTINAFQVELPSGRRATYAYPRYFFSNLSADIRLIFCEHCELLRVRWTRSNSRNISISDRRSVAILDAIVGPKR